MPWSSVRMIRLCGQGKSFGKQFFNPSESRTIVRAGRAQTRRTVSIISQNGKMQFFLECIGNINLVAFYSI